MKVVAINGSPHERGGTYLCLETVCDVLRQKGIETETVHIGSDRFGGCRGCRACFRQKDGRCAIDDDPFNAMVPAIREADGLLLGSPVHFAGMSGVMKTFLDRLFYVSGANGNFFYQKVGAAVTSVRRSGGVFTVDGMNHYLEYAGMLIPSSNYWNVVHGNGGEEVLRDKEGMQTLTVLGENMAWLMHLKESGMGSNPPPERQNKTYMNFIRD